MLLTSDTPVSDRDRIGVSYHDATTLYLDIAFEVLQGCQYSCEGCFVDKTSQDGLQDADYTNLATLIASAVNLNYHPLIAIIGPTDIFSAANSIEFLSKEKTVKLLHNFEKISFASTFFVDNNHTKDVIAVINEHYHDMDVEINITFEMRHLHNWQYLKKIQENRHRILQSITARSVKSFAIFNVFDYSRTKISDVLHDYDTLHKTMEMVFNTDIDFNFSIGRKPALTNEEFTNAAEQIKRIFNTNITTDTAKYVRFSMGKLTDSLVEKQLNFRNGEVYYSPMFYERYVSFSPHFKIPMVSWTIDEIEKFEHEIITTQLNNSDNKECGSCVYLGSCVERGILHLMDHHNLTTCILAKDAMNISNNYHD